MRTVHSGKTAVPQTVNRSSLDGWGRHLKFGRRNLHFIPFVAYNRIRRRDILIHKPDDMSQPTVRCIRKESDRCILAIPPFSLEKTQMQEFAANKSVGISRLAGILLQVFFYSVFFCKISCAETVEVKADSLKSLFDYTNPYRGQTFMLPAGVTANRLTVYVSSNIYRSFTFNLLLTEVDTANGLHPTNVLFESDPFLIPVGGKNILPYTANLGGIPLSGGKLYAFILDIFVSLNQIQADALWQYATLTGMNSAAAYAPGDHFYFIPDCTEQTGLPCGSREDHFAGSWIVEKAEDMGFILEYAPLPPPFIPSSITPSIHLLLLKGD
jgi:hypothetical protein